MKNNKKVLIIILIVLSILLVGVGVFAYVYLATDILKSDKELFFNYFSQIFSEDGFVDKKIIELNDKKMKNPYENSGKITVNVDYPEEEFDEIIPKVNNLSIKFLGKVDSSNKKVQQNIEIDYGNDVVLPINYLQYENKYGIQIDELSKKYIAIKNENLDKLISNITGQSIQNDTNNIANIDKKVEGILDTITSISEQLEKIEFTEEEQKQLKQHYGKYLQEQLLNEYFSKTKAENGEKISLEMTNEKAIQIIRGLLEKTKEKPIIINKINEIILQENENAETIDVEELDKLIEELKLEDDAEIIKFKIILTQNKKKLSEIIFQTEEFKISILKNVVENDLNYNLKFELEEAIIYFDIKYNGLTDLNNVEENYEAGIEVSLDDQLLKYDYKMNNETMFKEIVSIENLDKENAVFLNDYNQEQVTKFLTQVVTKLLDINKKQMEKLGVEEYGNPLLYTNPLILLGMGIFNSASEQIESTDFGEYEKQMFNDKFERYLGEEKSAPDVRALVDTVGMNNLSDETRSVELTLDGKNSPTREDITLGKLYSVEPVYNAQGYIIGIKILTK